MIQQIHLNVKIRSSNHKVKLVTMVLIPVELMNSLKLILFSTIDVGGEKKCNRANNDILKKRKSS